MSSEPQQSKDQTQEEERFWIDFDRQYFAPPHPSLLMCLKNHIWHTRHISTKIGNYLLSKKTPKRGPKKKRKLHLSSVKFPVRLLGVEKNPNNEGIFKYFNNASSYSNDQIQVLLENDNVYKPTVSAKHDSNQRLPTIYSSPIPDAIHLTLYIPPSNPKPKPETSNTDSNKGDPVDSKDDEPFNFVDAFGSVQLLDNDEVPQIISGPNPTWFTKGRARFKRGVELGPRYKKCDKLVKHPHGLLSDPVWQHFNTNYVTNSANTIPRLASTPSSSKRSDDDSDLRDGTDLLNYHSMCDLGSCRVDYSPLLFTFVASKKSFLCKRCLGFPRLSCNLCKNISGNSTAMFSSQYISDERYHMVYNLVDLFKLRSTTNEAIQSYYINPYKTNSREHSNFALTSREEAKTKEDDEEMNLIHNYVQTLEGLHNVFNNLLNRIVNEYKPDTSRWHEIESKMLDYYIDLYNNKTLDNRYTYSVQRQSVDVLQLRLKVLKSSELPGTWTDRALCSICGTDDDWDDDPILFCDCCFIPMHFCCLGYKPGTLSDIKQKLMMNKFQRMNYLNYLITNAEKPVKKLKFDRMETFNDMDDDEWYCPVCNYLMEQLSFLDENLVMAIIRTVGGPKNLEQLRLLVQSTSGNQGEPETHDRDLKEPKTKKQKSEGTFKYNLPYILGFDYDNPLERVYVAVHPTKAITNNTRVSYFKDVSNTKFYNNAYNPYAAMPAMPEPTVAHNDNPSELERTSMLNLYDYRKESISYNTNTVMDPRSFCKLLLSKKGLYFEHTFWSLLNRFNISAIQEYLNYYSMEDLYLARLVQQDKLIQSVKHVSKKRSSSMTGKVSSRSLSITSEKEFPGVKKEYESYPKEPEPKKDENRFDSNATMNCKNPLKKLYISINLRHLGNLPSSSYGSHTMPDPGMLRDYRKEDDDVDVVIKIPVCIFCGFDAYFPGGGPMKKTSNSGTWGHIKCALANDCTIEPDEINYSTFVPKIKALKCIFCNNYSTSSIQCSYGNCCKAFHVPCSSASPNCLFTWDSNGKADVLCPVHSKGLAPTSLLRKLQLRLMNAKDGKDKDYRDGAPEKETKITKRSKFFGKNKVKDKERDKVIKKISEQKDKTQEELDKAKEKDAMKSFRGFRDMLDTVSINENLYLNHFLRPNYSNLTKLLEILLNEKVGTIFQSNLCSNYYYKENVVRTASTVSINSSGLSSMSSMSSNMTSNSKSTMNQDESSSSNEDMYKLSDREDDEYVPSIASRSNTISRQTSQTNQPDSNLKELVDKEVEVVIELDDPEEDLMGSKNEELLKDSKNILLGKDQLMNKHNVAVGDRCPLNNINANNCFWCCLGLDLSQHNRHVFDDKTPSSKAVLAILYNNSLHNISEIKAIIESNYEDPKDASQPTDDSANDEHDKPNEDDGKAKDSTLANMDERELKIPWNILSSIIMDNVVDEKINIYINNDLVNNTKLIKRTESAIQKMASEALVRLFNTFEPDSTKYVIRTLFGLLKHIDFVNELDELYGYNSLYFFSSTNMDSTRSLDSKPELNIPNLNLNDNFAGGNLNFGNLLGTTNSISFSNLLGSTNILGDETFDTSNMATESVKMETDDEVPLFKTETNASGAVTPKTGQPSDLAKPEVNSAASHDQLSSNTDADYSSSSSQPNDLTPTGSDRGKKKGKRSRDRGSKLADKNQAKDDPNDSVAEDAEDTQQPKQNGLEADDAPPLSNSNSAPKENDTTNASASLTNNYANTPPSNRNDEKPNFQQNPFQLKLNDVLKAVENNQDSHIFNATPTGNRLNMVKNEKERLDARRKILKLLKEVNNVEVIKLDRNLLPNSILRKYVENKKITICKVCLEFKYIDSDIDVNKRKRNIYNESYRKCASCHVEVCNSCLTVARQDFENLAINASLIVGDYIGQEVDEFYFKCVRCKELEFDSSVPLLNCALCSRFDGLMLKVNPKYLSFIPCKTSLWNNYCYVHLICLEWLFWSKNINNSTRKLNRSQFEQSCNYCGLLTGATVTCSNSACYSKFHPTCAAFLGCKIDVGKKSENIVGAKRALCLRHTLISICRSSVAERKFMVAPCYLYEVLVNNNYFSTFFKAVYLSPNCINDKPKLTSRFKFKKRSRSIDYKSSISMLKMASYINFGLITNKAPQLYDMNITESVARNRLIQGMNYVFYQQNSKSPSNIFSGARHGEPRESNIREVKNIINLVKNGVLKPIQGSKRGRKPKSLDGSESDKRHKMSMEEILRYGHSGVLDNGEYYCPICFSIYFENSPGLPGDDLHWIGCDKCERWFHFVCAGVWVDYRDKDSWFCYHCDVS